MTAKLDTTEQPSTPPSTPQQSSILQPYRGSPLQEYFFAFEALPRSYIRGLLQAKSKAFDTTFGPTLDLHTNQLKMGKSTINFVKNDIVINEKAYKVIVCIYYYPLFLRRSHIEDNEVTRVVKYKCCHGYSRAARFGGGCEKQAELKPLLEVLDNVNATDFKRLIKTTGVDDLINDGNYTIFAPIGEALDNISDVISEMNKVDVVRRDSGDNIKDMIMNHIVPGFIDLNDYANEDVIYSANDNKSIRLNYYPTPGGGRLVTANCIRVARANLFASNGFVHLIDNIVPTSRGSIQDILEDSRISLFKQALDASKLASIFEDSGHYTLFIPTNKAFDKLDEKTKNKILSGNACAATILKHHISSHTVCTAAVIANATVHDDNGEVLNLERKSKQDIILEGKAKLIQSDILLKNGVVHFIDTVLVPESAMPVDQVLSEGNQTKFLELAEEAGLKETLDSMANITLFVPFNAAFDEPEAVKYLDQVRGNKEKLRDLILYHIAKGKLESCDMDESDILETELPGKTVALKVYPLYSNLLLKPFSPPPLVQCSTFTKVEDKACGSVIHEIDRMLIPPSKTLLELVEEDSRLSIFRSLLKGTEVENKLKDSNQNLTLIATTNYGFGRYKYNFDDLKENKTLADAVLTKHIIQRPVCCQQLESGDQIFNRWSPYDAIRNSQTMKDCNIIATNGILHTTNSFMYQQRY
ncbi:periostin-related [Holotrichia oblita]|uniref:Periostin-related n=1 Tax=Holotrichia oblita TaxID=644536 RepID=A0ACB9TEI7_HOLOL|nr:periostin-related [Holotrichia oblita]